MHYSIRHILRTNRPDTLELFPLPKLRKLALMRGRRKVRLGELNFPLAEFLGRWERARSSNVPARSWPDEHSEQPQDGVTTLEMLECHPDLISRGFELIHFSYRRIGKVVFTRYQDKGERDGHGNQYPDDDGVSEMGGSDLSDAVTYSDDETEPEPEPELESEPGDDWPVDDGGFDDFE